jgi:hypothetical protein
MSYVEQTDAEIVLYGDGTNGNDSNGGLTRDPCEKPAKAL